MEAEDRKKNNAIVRMEDDITKDDNKTEVNKVEQDNKIEVEVPTWILLIQLDSNKLPVTE